MELPDRHLSLQLEDLEKRLRETPSCKTFERRVLQIQIDSLKNRVRFDHGAEGIPQPPKLGLNEHAGAGRGGVQGRGEVSAAEVAALARARFTAHFGVVPVTYEMKRGLDRIREGFARAHHQLSAKGQEAIAKGVDWFETRYTQAYLEGEALPQATTILKRAIDAGYQVIIATERSGVLRHRISPLEFVTLNDLDSATDGLLRRILPAVRNVYGALQAQFGNVADYSGSSESSSERDKPREEFLSGRFRILYSTYETGEIALSLRDTDYPDCGIEGGHRPRASIFLRPPLSGVLLKRAVGLTWWPRAKSDVHAVFLSTDSERDVLMMRQKVAPLLRVLGAFVLGERDSLATAMSGYSDEQRVTALQDALAFAEGNRVRISANDFYVRGKARIVGLNDWSLIEFPSAETAMCKKANAANELTDASVYTPYQSDFGMLIPESPSDASDGKVAEAVGNAAASGEGQSGGVKAQALEPAEREVASSLTPDAATEQELGHVRESIRNADYKAMFLLAVIIAVLGYLISHNAPAGWFRSIAQWSLVDVIGFFSVIGLAGSAATMLAVLYPSLRDLRLFSLPQLSKMCLSKCRRLNYGFWIGAGAAFTSLLFLILSRKPHPAHYIF